MSQRSSALEPITWGNWGPRHPSCYGVYTSEQQLATELEVDVHETIGLACTAKPTKTHGR